MTACLLINTTFEPLRVLPLRRAVTLVLEGRAEVLEESDRLVRSSNFEMKAPLVIRLLRFVRVPYRARLPLTRRNLIARDHGKCGYCGNAGSTIDHIVPRSLGGRHEWENVALACSPCNSDKADKALVELTGNNRRTGKPWELRVTPRPPHGLVWFTIGYDFEPAWAKYLSVAA